MASEFKFPNMYVSSSIPEGEIWFVTPPEEIEVIAPDGTISRVTLRPARVDKIINIGPAE